jgi:hypothetical protein
MEGANFIAIGVGFSVALAFFGSTDSAEMLSSLAMKFAPSMLEAFAGIVCNKDKHTFVAGGDLATVIQNNLPRECAVLPSNDL